MDRSSAFLLICPSTGNLGMVRVISSLCAQSTNLTNVAQVATGAAQP
jgi:hypothetical protein